MISIYAYRIIRRGWQKYLLSFLSLVLTATLVTLILGLSASAGVYLSQQNKIILGGDISLQSSFPINETAFFQSPALVPLKSSHEMSFSGTLAHSTNTRAVTFRVVDSAFPLYGTLELMSGLYENIAANEILLDVAAAQKLTASVGDTVSFGTTTYRVAGIIARQPDALVTGFQFMPTVVLSKSGFGRAQVATDLLRAEYTARYLMGPLTDTDLAALRARAEMLKLRLRVAGNNSSQTVRGLDTVERFLTVAVLTAAILAAVNVYASTLYLIMTLRRSFAILRALGLTAVRMRGILITAFGSVVVVASGVGIIGGLLLTNVVRGYAATGLGVVLPAVFSWQQALTVLSVVLATSIAAFIPAVLRLGRMTPQALLTTKDEPVSNERALVRYGAPALAAVPLAGMAIVLLGSVLVGLEVVLGVLAAYLLIAFVYRSVLDVLYRARTRYSFGTRSIVAQKKYDGLFGVVSFTSLFIALTAVCTLVLTHASLTEYLAQDLERTIPTVYVLDVQPSQHDTLTAAFPSLQLFPNVHARIVSIDGVQVQEAIERRDASVDRELGREFNVTYRTSLLSSESVISGVSSVGVPGELSVEEGFAIRANLHLDSRVALSVQGFPVTATVTSIRSADTRSGLPFFYFVMSPSDLARFPATYFGYAFLASDEVTALSSYVARELPNVTIIDTREIGTLANDLIRTLLLIVLVIVLPPVILACMLIVALIILTYRTRRRDGARLLTLGAAPRYVERHYLLETISTTLGAAIAAYLSALMITWGITHYALNIDVYVLGSARVVYAIVGIVLGVLLLGLVLWRSDRRPVARILAYEENH